MNGRGSADQNAQDAGGYRGLSGIQSGPLEFGAGLRERDVINGTFGQVHALEAGTEEIGSGEVHPLQLQAAQPVSAQSRQ